MTRIVVVLIAVLLLVGCTPRFIPVEAGVVWDNQTQEMCWMRGHPERENNRWECSVPVRP